MWELEKIITKFEINSSVYAHVKTAHYYAHGLSQFGIPR
ncbi:unnamed protein product, partial [marine sediment metagenome]